MRHKLALDHIFGSDLTCCRVGCNRTWEGHQKRPRRCQGRMYSSQRGLALARERSQQTHRDNARKRLEQPLDPKLDRLYREYQSSDCDRTTFAAQHDMTRDELVNALRRAKSYYRRKAEQENPAP